MKHFLYSFISIVCSVPVYAQRINGQAPGNCVTPQNDYGLCTTLSFCPQVVNVFRTQNRRAAEQYVFALQRACGTRNINGDPVVCCRSPVRNNESQNSPSTEDITFVFPTEEPDRPANTRNSQNENPFLPSPRPFQEMTTERRTESTTQRTLKGTRIVPSAAQSSASCRGPDMREGNCVALEACQELLDKLLNKQRDEVFANFLRASNRICGNSGSTVCCPGSEMKTTSPAITKSSKNVIPRRLPTEDEGCGYAKNSNKKIVGGQVSKRGAWPWVALLAYESELSASPFKCGGALITARHVLTAAHCIRGDLLYVRLGEHDLTTDTEAAHVDIRIVRKEAHPNYDRRDGHSDIALLYLERNVEFSDFILPICMPRTNELRQKSYVRHSPFVVGWGKTMEGGRSANVLQELQIPVYDNKVCMDNYQKINRLFSEKQFNSAVLCAGVLSGGMDTCQGDSGGPLMIPELFGGDNRYYLIGVVSYGVGCARPGVLGVYTSTQYFMNWIEQKIADTI